MIPDWDTNLLTKFHDYQTINVASIMLTSQNVDDEQRTTDKRRSQKLTMSMGTFVNSSLRLIPIGTHIRSVVLDNNKIALMPPQHVVTDKNELYYKLMAATILLLKSSTHTG
ncbi:hypothetical protein DPMN_039365 [Dreissena polymorpha]|uniref:Uncharacterized protein n=1 Tax=Dreissena polymorpha TaxID=45954 RepID=A0A9D4MH67_DREPO|nr:hypothetical protein DPMN_039365 [Dreissena polymorpha]